MISFVRQRPVGCVLILSAVVAIVGTILWGPGFVSRPLPIPERISQIWFGINFFLFIFAGAFTYRLLLRFQDEWTWQETAFIRGAMLILGGGVLALAARLFHDPAATLGTPLVTAGALLIIWATLSDPERLTGHGHGSAG